MNGVPEMRKSVLEMNDDCLGAPLNEHCHLGVDRKTILVPQALLEQRMNHEKIEEVHKSFSDSLVEFLVDHKQRVQQVGC